MSYLNREKSDVRFLSMEMTKVTDRVDAIENYSNDDKAETKNCGTINVELTG